MTPYRSRGREASETAHHGANSAAPVRRVGIGVSARVELLAAQEAQGFDGHAVGVRVDTAAAEPEAASVEFCRRFAEEGIVADHGRAFSFRSMFR